VLSHGEIVQAVSNGEITIEPFVPELVRRNSYLLRLGGHFRRVQTLELLDIRDPESMRHSRGEEFAAADVEVNSNSLVLASSFERISLGADLVGVLSGISNVARLGTIVHATSAFINAGYGLGNPGRVVFELATVGGLRVKLYRGLPICHLAVVRLSEASSYPHASARTGQDTPGASDLFTQFGNYIV
jgi:dCTP deaminase